jgi:hypothetical protein
MAHHNGKRDIRHKIQEQNADLVGCHAPVVKGIELSNSQTKPTPMKPKHPIVGTGESQEPDEQRKVVNKRAPQEKIADQDVVHGDFLVTANRSVERCARSALA